MKKLTNLSTRTLKRLILATILAASAMFVSSTSASAQFVGTAGIQFAPNGTTTYAGTGVLGESFTAVESGITAKGNGGINQSATAVGSTGISLAINDAGTAANNDYYSSAGNNGTTDLLNHFISNTNDTTVGLTFTLSGLKAGDTYDVAVYAGPNGNQGGQTAVTATLNGTSIGTANPQASALATPANGFQLGVNYVTGSAIADSSGDIVVQDFSSTGSSYVLTNGIGISDVTNAAPEPGTWAMLLAGAGTLVGVQAFRRRNA